MRVSPVRLELAEEPWAFVRARMIRTLGPYLLADGSNWEPRVGGLQPSACTLDVGLAAPRRGVVIQANPAWCSGSYGVDLDEAANTVVTPSVTAPGAASTSDRSARRYAGR